ncbi:WD40 repeat-like protein [Gonapodya prolifera JEL478]|uniref:WD40 repeat-like protein n=1 Tax=Gonapodya prolifera (strain JEL478) TaxID=1344416 RepID=A0A139ASX5_GONPJ|nr:WD40 repeat-like protein [Gonapodya prolifera JEL478]|eukprot:KXS19819.1 WD40 repeat-like protein [Gonapodya prolifera JEL478]
MAKRKPDTDDKKEDAKAAHTPSDTDDVDSGDGSDVEDGSDVDVKEEDGDDAESPDEDTRTPLFRVVVGSYERFVYGINVYGAHEGGDGDVKEEKTDTDADADADGEPHKDATTPPELPLTLSALFVHPSHVSSIKCLASTSTSHLLASGSVDESIRLYNLRTLRELGSLFHHQGTVSRLAFVGTRYMVSAGEDGKVCVWRSKDWELVKELKGHKGKVLDMAVHPSGRVALTVGEDKTLRCWNLTNASLALTAKLQRPPSPPTTGGGYVPPQQPLPDRILFTPDGDHYMLLWPTCILVCKTTAAGGADGGDKDVVIHPPKLGKFLSVCAFPVSGKGGTGTETVLAVGCEDASVALYSLDGTPLHADRWGLTAAACTARVKCVAARGAYLVAATSKGTVVVWDAKEAVKAVRDGRARDVKPLGVFEAACRVTCLEVVGVPGVKEVGREESRVKEEGKEGKAKAEVKKEARERKTKENERGEKVKAGVKRKAGEEEDEEEDGGMDDVDDVDTGSEEDGEDGENEEDGEDGENGEEDSEDETEEDSDDNERPRGKRDARGRGRGRGGRGRGGPGGGEGGGRGVSRGRGRADSGSFKRKAERDDGRGPGAHKRAKLSHDGERGRGRGGRGGGSGGDGGDRRGRRGGGGGFGRGRGGRDNGGQGGRGGGKFGGRGGGSRGGFGGGGRGGQRGRGGGGARGGGGGRGRGRR